MNIFFLKTGDLITNLAPTLLHIPILKYCPCNLTKYEGKQNSKIPILNSLVKSEKFGSTTYVNTKIPIFHLLHEFENIDKSVTTTANLNFILFVN